MYRGSAMNTENHNLLEQNLTSRTLGRNQYWDRRLNCEQQAARCSLWTNLRELQGDPVVDPPHTLVNFLSRESTQSSQ